MLVSAAVITILSFTPFYLYGLRKRKIKLPKSVTIYNCIVLTLAVGITVAMVSFLLISLFNSSFKNIQLDIYVSSLIVGAYSGFLIYIIAPLALNMDTSTVTRLFAIVTFSGIILSALTNNNPNWWQINFSYLGWGNGFSSLSFNLTMILSGLLIIALSTQFTNDLKRSEHVFDKKDVNLNILSILFIILGLQMSALGVFPYDRLPRLHDLLGYSLPFVFGILVLSLRFIFPKIDKAFLTNSYIVLGLMTVCYVLFGIVGYMSLTAFELIAFVITLAWLLMFVNKISKMSKLDR